LNSNVIVHKYKKVSQMDEELPKDAEQAALAEKSIREESGVLPRRIDEVSPERLKEIRAELEEIEASAEALNKEEIDSFTSGFAMDYGQIKTDKLMELELRRELSDWPSAAPPTSPPRDTQEEHSQRTHALYAFLMGLLVKIPGLGKLIGTAT
jgi:hypothetical protein